MTHRRRLEVSVSALSCFRGAVSQRIKKRIEEAFGWAETVAGLRKARHRGLPKIDWQFTLAMVAYNLVRLPKLLGAAP